MPPIAIFHLLVGGLGLVSGAAALIVRKGSPAHRAAGRVFFIAMLSTAASGVYLALSRSQPSNAIAGAITLYLLVTGLMAIRRGEGRAGLFELAAFLIAATGAAAGFYFAILAVRSGTAMLGGVPYLVFASIVALAAALDLSVVLRRGLSGRQKIARHLWRMHLGFAAAVGSFFPGQIEIFPAFVRDIRPFIILFTPPFLVLGLMIFWLVRVLCSSAFRSAAPAPPPGP